MVYTQKRLLVPEDLADYFTGETTSISFPFTICLQTTQVIQQCKGEYNREAFTSFRRPC